MLDADKLALVDAVAAKKLQRIPTAADAHRAAREAIAAKPPPLPDGVMLTCGASLKPEPVRWLWGAWLARGKLHVLAGAPGQGKTTIALSVAAAVTRGGLLPDGGRAPVGNVLVWSGEDDPADTLLPRLLAMGADPARVFFVSGTRIAGELVNFDPARDMAALEAQALAIGGVRLLIVDPIVSAVTGDSHKNTEVRRALQPVVDLAARLDAAAIGISHFSKGGQGSDPASRVVGSIAFTAVARVVLVAAKVKGDDGNERRILARAKSNIGPDEGGFEYSIEQAEPLPGIHASFIAWGKAVDGTARELLAEPEPEASASDTSDAVGLLRDELSAADWTPAKQAQKAVASQGFSTKQIWSASKKLGVVRKRGGFAGDWYWRLPGGADTDPPIDSKNNAIDSIDSTFQKLEPMESMRGAVESMEPSPADEGEVF
jgi:putative DNA primase/helicase